MRGLGVEKRHGLLIVTSVPVFSEREREKEKDKGVVEHLYEIGC